MSPFSAKNIFEEDIVPSDGSDIPDQDTDDVDSSLEEIQAQIDRTFNEGALRLAALGKLRHSVDHRRDGIYRIKYAASKGNYADFYDQANYEYLKANYPWLHTFGGGIGIDEDQATDSHGSIEDFLTSILEESWEQFLSDMKSLSNYPVLDEDRAAELEQEETARWIEEDGGPDLVKGMVEKALNAYDAYLLSKVTPEMVAEWMSATDSYPESTGEGTVWMDMERLSGETDVQEWFLEEVEDDEEGWTAHKRQAYEDGAAEKFELLLKEMAHADPQIECAYARMDAESLWQLFLSAFPDEPRGEDDPYWYLWKPDWNQSGRWKPGYAPEKQLYSDWKEGYQQALDYLKETDWFVKLVQNWPDWGSKDHPEFQFEAKEPEDDDLDDPALYLKHGGGLAENKVYEDDQIIVFVPRDKEALNRHLVTLGHREADDTAWADLFKYSDVFAVQAKSSPDLQGESVYRDLAVIWGIAGSGLNVYASDGNRRRLEDVLKNPDYGRNIRRMLLRHYRRKLEDEAASAGLLMQLGGVRELRRAEARGLARVSDLGVEVGLHYVSRHRYKLAAKAFGRPASTLTPKGVWLVYDNVADLAPVFSNEDAARTVFDDDHHVWFDHYYTSSYMRDISVQDVLRLFDQRAINHIRSVMVNRRVYFPDTDEWVTTTPKFLSDYSDAELLDWLANPTDEDKQDEVWDDIIEAIKLDGVAILTQASADNVYKAYMAKAVRAVGGTQHEWTVHPTKKYASGEKKEAFMVFVPWSAVQKAASDYRSDHDEAFSGDLESLMIEAAGSDVDVDTGYHKADWNDVDKDYAKENLHYIYELQPPEPIPGSPGYLDPNQLELPVDDLP